MEENYTLIVPLSLCGWRLQWAYTSGVMCLKVQNALNKSYTVVSQELFAPPTRKHFEAFILESSRKVPESLYQYIQDRIDANWGEEPEEFITIAPTDQQLQAKFTEIF